jgi:ribosomal protein S18 acetylase RimI-like enzyme/uncharacterized OsmC-like protein
MSSAERIKELAEQTAKAFAIDPSLAAGGGRTRVRRTEGLACEIEDGAWKFICDTPASAGGAGEGPDPGVLIRGALGACLTMDIVTWAARFGVEVTTVEVEVESAMDARGNYGVDDSVPPGYQAVTCRIAIESPDGEDAVRHVVETAEAHNPRLYDLTHAIPVSRELTVKRPASTNGVRGVVNGSARKGIEGVNIRPARPEDCGDIARLFLISSDGLAEYIWSQAGPEGASLLETGRRRYAREGVAFSYQNCLVAEEDGRVIAMLHSFVMPPKDKAGDDPANDDGEPVDPVLRPYAELEDPGSLYISGVAVTPDHRGRGLGRRLMEEGRARAEALGLPRISLICFEANETAMQLYRRLGYVEVDRRPVVPHPSLHYSDGDAVLLVRGLD